MSMQEQPSADLVRFVHAADALPCQTGPAVSCLDGRARATATARTCPGARYPSWTEVASADGQDRRSAEAPGRVVACRWRPVAVPDPAGNDW